LQALACPECRTSLRLIRQQLACSSGHGFPVNSIGIPLLGTSAEISDNREQKQEESAAAYAAMRAFSAETLRHGASEGLYRTVSDLLLRLLSPSGARRLLDLGCGPGRTLVDAAEAFPRAWAIGADNSPGSLAVAYAIGRFRGLAVEADLRRWGFGFQTIRGRALSNIGLVQADAERLPFRSCESWMGFDAVTCVNLLDRVENPETVLDEIGRVTRKGGWLIATTPMNWRHQTGGYWSSLADLDDLTKAVETRGFVCEIAFDDLTYREIIDARGSQTEWRVAVVCGRRI
jgi:ubiquinone/menaquinone biosynthesis C-methylase UbiE